MSDVIIACDFSSKEETLKFLDQFKEEKPFVKIGMELFYAEGGEIVKEIKKRGHKIFLDLKLCDIPNTVYKAMKNIAALGVDMTNVHAFGSIEMMKAAKKAINEVNPETKLIAVTVLTSSDQNVLDNELMIDGNINDVILKYASNTKEAGLDGVVCSPLESKIIKEKCGEDFLTVTPGIRFADDAKGDQKRVTTPAMAKEIGSSYIVVGRSITGAKDPVEAYRRCVREFIGE
ncbi:MAG: orotidine-5'-phosphate decarboxylase [Solobacterium sp.]|nr:orotidine-5'-phosphate decarboxylase [Erysipelotrichaceae bacterium]MCI6700896.1 orotidine-5'-phosphate decarboxylase [Solobacterium sp.]MCI7731948.1 orotidine-5'-phosphate decarboxylase [Solobacterium sp.]MDD5983183.1 orotidine-5'-phosphate decarboxylase [Solobacterium sp.]MDD6498404.1 orotidine-5'-phosphate decarboxylase [Solobacterium sp.]